MSSPKVKQTDAHITQALLTLLKDKKFSKVTVQDIITEASINRSTFYRHFLDKYDIIERWEGQLFEQLAHYYQDTLETVTRKQDIVPEDLMTAGAIFFYHLKPYYDQLQILLGDNGLPETYLRFQKTLEKLLIQSLSLFPKSLNHDLLNLIIRHQTSSFMGSLIYWLHNPHLDEEKIFQFHSQVTKSGLLGMLEQHL